jgi:DNA-binding transcriptional MerR regulator
VPDHRISGAGDTDTDTVEIPAVKGSDDNREHYDRVEGGQGEGVRWVSLTEASQGTGVAKSTLRKWYRQGLIKSQDVDGPHGPEKRVVLSEVERLASERRIGRTVDVASPEQNDEPGITLTLVEAVTDISHRWAEAEGRAATAEAKVEHLQARLAEARAELAETRNKLAQTTPWAVPNTTPVSTHADPFNSLATPRRRRRERSNWWRRWTG